MTQDCYERAINYTSHVRAVMPVRAFSEVSLGYDCVRETLAWTEQEGAFSHVIWEMQKTN